MENFIENQNKAFEALISNCVTYMKDNGASDADVKLLIDNSIQGIINTIQDYKRFPNHVYNIIDESSKQKTVIDGRKVGMMCELLDRIEDSLSDKVYDLLDYNNVVDLKEEKFKRDHNMDFNDVLDLLSKLQCNGDLDFTSKDLDD